MQIVPLSIPPKKLSQSILSTDSTFKLNNIEGWDGNNLTSSDLGTQAFVVFKNDTGTQIEIMEIDPATIASASITILYRGLKYNGEQTVVAANKYNWPANETTVMMGTDVPQMLRQFVNLSDAQTVAGVKTFSSFPVTPSSAPTTDYQIANKKYIDDIAILGAAKATDTVYGIAKLSIPAVSPTDPIVVGNNDTRLPASAAQVGYIPTSGQKDALVGTSGTPGSSNKYVTNDDTGTSGANKVLRLDGSGYLPALNASLLTNIKFGGTGADGALSASSGTTTIDCTSLKYVVKNYTSISLTGTAKLAFSNPHTGGTIVILKSQGNVTLTADAPIINIASLGATGGTGGNTADGNVGTAGNSIVPYLFATTGGGKGKKEAAPDSAGVATDYSWLFNNKFLGIRLGVGGGGGGGGGGTSVGGDGGRGGGALYIECGGAWNFTTASGISIAGANGTAGSGTSGGGGGGAAGSLLVLYTTLTANSGTIVATGGNGGAASGSNAVYGSGGSGGGNTVAGGNGGGTAEAGTAGSTADGAGGTGGAASTTSGGGGGGAGGVYLIQQNSIFV